MAAGLPAGAPSAAASSPMSCRCLRGIAQHQFVLDLFEPRLEFAAQPAHLRIVDVLDLVERFHAASFLRNAVASALGWSDSCSRTSRSCTAG